MARFKQLTPRFVQKLLRSNQGVALIEFAIIFPVFFLLLFGGIELNRLVLAEQKHEKAGYVLADIVTRYQPATRTGASGEISVAEMNRNVFPQMTRIMAPYDGATRQAVIITSIRKSGNNKTIQWQIAGGGTLSGCDGNTPATCVNSIVNGLAPSAITPAVAGTAANLPAEQNALINAYTPSGGDSNIIVTEVFYFYQPILRTLLQGVGTAGGGLAGFRFYLAPRIFVKRTYFVPRNGNLFYLPNTFPVQ